MIKLIEYCRTANCENFIEPEGKGPCCSLCVVKGVGPIDCYFMEKDRAYKRFLKCPNRSIVKQIVAVEKL